jgi:hypothetical protein
VSTAGQQQHRVFGQSDLRQRLPHDRRQRPVGPFGVVRSAQHDRVAALDRQRGAIDSHVRPRLIDHGNNPEWDPDLAQINPALQSFLFEPLSDRVLERRHRPYALGHSCDPLLAQRQPVLQRRAQPLGPLIGNIGGIRLEDLRPTLTQQPRSRLQRSILDRRRRSSQLPGGPLCRNTSLSNGHSRSSHAAKGSWE